MHARLAEPKTSNNEKRKILLVGSSGGHLLQLLRVKEIFRESDNDRFELVWVCFKKPDAEYFLKSYRTYWCFHPTTRNFVNLIRNSLQAIKIMAIEKPDMVMSSGAAVAAPYFFLAWLFRVPRVYIESFTRVDSPSLTGRLLYPISNLFFVQWESMLKIYSKAKCVGRLP